MECKVWSVKCRGWSVQRSVECGECEVWSVKRKVLSLMIKCGVWSLECVV